MKTKLRYCPNCRRKVGKKFTLAQFWLLLALYGCLIVPGILYSVFHARKCPICGTPTSVAFEKKAVEAKPDKKAKKGKKK